ncbi:D-lactate dehydrogenase [cytochrome], mitochondrial [Cyphellophora attinorum]|uniref:D-lactate dehydrogenase (cytochrome) n=1 Tax=Cyphellophora attinorum TaxID=1664694 RepID=A0A0N1H7K4_9EURO|nr:D-lactate dehydrogenase [cytochrome], mitochondrial [Phialophora attinorum]KPI38705.1 D-lactate dehydrogenase [cytochrome], mitochondrial [Phialophora attinorum]
MNSQAGCRLAIASARLVKASPASPLSIPWSKCGRSFSGAARRLKETNFEGTPVKPEGTPAKKGEAELKGSLHGTTYDRVIRERANEARYEKMQQELEQRYKRPHNSFAVGLALVFTAVVAYRFGCAVPQPPPTTSTTKLKDAFPPQLDTRGTTLQAAWTDFALIVGKENVSSAKEDLDSHAGSEWSSYQHTEKERPFMIVYPGSTEEVSRVMKVCHDRKLPVTALSGGTSLEGHFAPTRGGVCIDLARMDQILQFHPEDLDIIVQPALGWEDLNEYLAEHNLFFPPDPGPGAKIGGMVGTGCSGTNAYRYGTMREWVVSLTVVMADGTVIKTRRRPRKSSAGYNLTQMFIGSEGTLGIVTEAILKVTPLPQSSSVAVATFPTIHAAADCVAKIVKGGIQLAGMEILDDVQMKCINKSGTTDRKWSEVPSLFFKFAGSPEGVKEQIAIVKKLAKASKNKDFEFARNNDEAAELWSARKEALWSVMALRNEGDHVWTTDVAVPISSLADIVKETRDDIEKSGLTAGIVGHVGDGNFHSIILYNDQNKDVAENVVHRMIKKAIDMDGTVTGEHGVGLKKREYLKEELSEDTVDAMRKLKLAFDPLGILNVDKIVQLEKGH